MITVTGKILHIGIIGGTGLCREGLCHLLTSQGYEIEVLFSTDRNLFPEIQEKLAGADLLFLLTGSRCNPFEMLHRTHTILNQLEPRPYLLLLSDQIERGQVYTAVSMNTNGIMDMECSAEELAGAVKMVMEGNQYLSPGVTRLLVDDMSTALDKDGGGRLPMADLSRREVEIVQLLCEGLSGKEVGRQLHISPKTVENHRYNIYRKCNVESIVSLMRYAVQHGIVKI